MSNLVLGRVGIALEERVSRHQHAGGAEAALQSVFLKEPFLNCVQLAVLFQTLDRQYLASVGLNGEY